MADMTITCPHCSQRITCDVLWAGHTLQCPTCHKDLAVPAPAPAPDPEAVTPEALIPKVPQGPPKLAMGPKPSAQDPEPRVIPIRTLVAPPPKKKNPLVPIVTAVLVLIVLGVAAYLGYPYIKGMLQKSDAGTPSTGQSASAAASAPLQEATAAMDIADPSGDSAAPSPAASAPKAAKQPAPAAAQPKRKSP